MKKMFAVLLALVFVFTASLALASGSEVKSSNSADASQTQNQGQFQGQTATASQGQKQTNEGNSLGVNIDQSQNGNISANFPYAPGMPSMYPAGHFPGYERQVNDSPLKEIVTVINSVDEDSFARFRARLIVAQGEDFFKQLEKGVHLLPTMPKYGLYPATNRVYIVNDVPNGSVVEFMGIMTVDSSLDPKFVKKGEFWRNALTQFMHMFAGKDVLKDGVNIMMPAPTGDFFRAYVSPKGSQWGIGGSGGWLQAFSGALFGASVAPQYTSSNQTTGMYGDKALTYICFRVQDIDRFLHPPQPQKVAPPSAPAEPKKPACNPGEIWEQILKVEKAIEACKFWSRENFDSRSLAAYLYEKYYVCTGKTNKKLLEKSIEHAELAQKNYDEVHHPTHPRLVSRENWDEAHAISVLKIVYWNEAAAKRIVFGRDCSNPKDIRYEVPFAREKGLERMPESIDEILEIR
jgi:hypothetical protein